MTNEELQALDHRRSAVVRYEDIAAAYINGGSPFQYSIARAFSVSADSLRLVSAFVTRGRKRWRLSPQAVMEAARWEMEHCIEQMPLHFYVVRV